MNKMIEALNEITNEVERRFGGLSGEEINRRPDPDSWSVGQCLEHLIKTNELFFPDLDKIAAGTRKNSLWEYWSPFSVFGGRLLIHSLKKDERKFKVPTPAIAPPSDVAPEIVEIFAAHQQELIARITACAKADAYKIVVTSPFMRLMTYRLTEGFEIIVEHERRHVRQATRVISDFGAMTTAASSEFQTPKSPE